MIEARQITRHYDGLQVLKGIDISVKKGEIVSIVGPSGAGKSTLLHIIGTIDRPNTGQVLINGQNPFYLSSKRLAAFRNTHIGFIFQFHHLLPEFSALENTCFPNYIAGKSRKEAEERAKYLLNLLNLSARLEHRPNQLSGGEQQRVAVARALMNKPSIVLADEPSGNLDTQSANELHKLFFDLRKELNQTFIIVTHNEELAEMADRKLTLIDGRLER